MNLFPRTGKGNFLRAGRRAWGAALVALFCCTALVRVFSASSNGPTATASIAEPTVDVGQATEYRIDVVGGRADRPPAAPSVAGLTLNYAGQTYSSQYDFNTLTKTVTTSYIFSVESSRAGRYTIPGVEVTVNGQVLHTPPVVLNVGDNATATNRQVFVELLVPKKTAYLGESVPVEVRTYFAQGVGVQLTPDMVLNGEGFSVAKFTPQKEAPSQTLEGVNYRIAMSKSAITGLRIGTLAVGPVEVDPIVQLPRSRSRRRSLDNDPLDAFFNNAFNGLNLLPPQQVKLQTEPVQVEIKPLPPVGRPADFTGAVGQFHLDAQAEPRKAQTGDPVTVHLILSGKGNFDRVSAPTLEDTQGLRTYPPSSRFKPDDEVGLSGIKTFDQVVIADSARNSLPAYHFNYFDPATGKYVEMSTPPIAVRVEGGNLSTPIPSPSAVLASSAQPSPSARPMNTPAPRRAEDILFIRTDEGARLGADAFHPNYEQRGFWAIQSGGLLALIGLGAAGFLRERARSEGQRRVALRQREESELQRLLQRPEVGRRDFYQAATRLAEMRAAPTLTPAVGSGSGAETRRNPALDPETGSIFEEIYRRHDELAYSGGPAAVEPVPPGERERVLGALRTLDRNPRR